jgi:hypothetical protein
MGRNKRRIQIDGTQTVCPGETGGQAGVGFELVDLLNYT